MQGDDEDIIDESSKKQVVNDSPILFNQNIKELQKYYIWIYIMFQFDVNSLNYKLILRNKSTYFFGLLHCVF